MSSYKHFFQKILTVVTFIFCDCTLANTVINRASTLILGKVSDNPSKHYSKLKPAANYLATRFGDMGIVKGDVLLAENNQQMIDYLRTGKIDFITETAISSALFIQQANAIPLLKKWKNGTPSYQSLIFVRKDSAINSIEDLLGKRIALEDLGSTTAYFIPMATLHRHGLPVVSLSSPRGIPPAKAVGTYITNNDLTISPLVYAGTVEAGALSTSDWQKNKRVPANHKKAFKIIYQSKHWPRMIELAAPHVNIAIRERFKKILLKAHLDPTAQPVLKAYQKTSRFDELNKDDWHALSVAQDILSVIKWSE